MTQPPNPPTHDSRSPKTKDTHEVGDLGAPQVVFDTVGGPNLRLRDNLIQLVSVVVAVVLTFLVTLIITRNFPMSLVIGILGGMIGGILISGAALGIYRAVTGVKKMTRK